MKLVTTYKSPNHYNGRKIKSTDKDCKADVIVFHQTGGDTLSPALNWYMSPNAQVSPNWLIDKDGTIYQLVNPDNAAWCNGTNTIVGDNRYYGYALSSIVKSRAKNCNLYSYSAEFVHCAHGEITSEQRTAAVELIQQVIIPHMKANGVIPIIDRAHVIGHSEVTPKTRDPEKLNCPGKYFPFDEIIARVNGKTATTVSDNITPVKFIYQAISSAAIRAGASKSSQLYSRVTKWQYYLAESLIDTPNGKWFKYVDRDAYSKLVDGGSLFAKVGEYTIKTVIATGLNVRTAPTTKSEKITVLKADDKVFMWNAPTTSSDGQNWVKIIINGKIGYVAEKYLR